MPCDACSLAHVCAHHNPTPAVPCPHMRTHPHVHPQPRDAVVVVVASQICLHEWAGGSSSGDPRRLKSAVGPEFVN
eukprot:771986-Pyramimonas_sp.AAC.1